MADAFDYDLICIGSGPAGQRAAIQAASEERLQALDDHLWTYRDDRLLPHGTDRETDAASQPVVLTLRDANPNAASIRFLVEGAALPADAGSGHFPAAGSGYR